MSNVIQELNATSGDLGAPYYVQRNAEGAAAAGIGSSIYVLGGGGGKYYDYDAIWRFDATTGTATNMNATLPSPRASMASATDGRRIYLFGGICDNLHQCARAWGDGWTDEILIYDTVTDTLTTSNAHLPFYQLGGAAVYDGHEVLIFGGYPCLAGSNDLVPCDKVLRYDPKADSLVVATATLPSGRTYVAASWDPRPRAGGTCQQGCAYVFGGQTGPGSYVGDVVGYDPAGNRIFSPPARLPTASVAAWAAWTGKEAVVATCVPELPNYGASEPCSRYSLLTYNLTPERPDVTATRGSHRGEIDITWSQPHIENVTRYTLYAGSTPEALAPLAELGNVSTYTDRGLGNGEARYYAVAGWNDLGRGSLSNASLAVAPDVPSPPRDVTATPGRGAGEITVDWSRPATDNGLPILGYMVEATDAQGAKSSQDAGTYPFAIFQGLWKGASMTFKVIATNDAGSSVPSASATAHAPDVPARPVALQIARAHDRPTLANLSWTAPDDDRGLAVTSYEIWRGVDGAAPGKYGVAYSTMFNDSNAPTLAVASYVVRAVNPVGVGDESDNILLPVVVPPSAPRGLHARNTSTSIELSWMPPQDDGGAVPSNYTVYSGPSADHLSFLQVVNRTNFSDTRAPPGLVAYYEVTASNVAGEGPHSSEAFDAAPGPARTVGQGIALVGLATIGVAVVARRRR